MANQRTLPRIDWRNRVYAILQCETGGLASELTKFRLWKEAKSKLKESNSKPQKGDNAMHNYEFRFRGGAQKLEQANYKFHVFIADNDANEHHMYGALKNGLVEQKDHATNSYASATPILKVFTATAGFGVPKEFFSYFIMLSSTTDKIITIKPLGFKKLVNYDWYFVGKGKFMSREEIRRFFGASSDTWKFYQRQSFLSRTRLQELVSISQGDVMNKTVEQKHEEVRMVRFD